MARNRQRRLQAIYDQVPDAGCKGLCHPYCGIVAFTPTEEERLRRHLGEPIPVAMGSNLTCPLLSGENRCTAYEARPLICRLWGVTEKMPCPYGCTPERVLTDEEATGLVGELMEIDGYRDPVVPWSPGVG